MRGFLIERCPGAWAGAVVHNYKELGLVLLTSQEKCDRMKAIVIRWLEQVRAGDLELDHKELPSDRGFLVYATRPYPSMVLYLKGVHLSLETWRGGRDEEG